MPNPVLAAPRKRRSLRVLGVTALVTAMVGLGAGPALAATIVPDGVGPAIGAALAGPGANVTGATFTNVASPLANGTIDSLGSFPTHGANFGVLTTGLAASVDDPNSNVPDATDASDDKSENLGGGLVRGTSSYDVSVLKVDLNVPATANCLRFDFQFLSEEFAEYVNTQYNDAFIAELDSSTWSTTGTSTINAPNNFAFDTGGNVISVNTSFTSPASALLNAAGTYDGATPLLSAAHPVTPGAHSVYFSIFDQGDHILDSAAFLDNLQVGFVPDPTMQCVPGAQLKRFELNLTPASATKDVGTAHTVTATLTNVDDGTPIAGGSINFEASGANTAAGTATTNAAGQATFTYTGTAVGTDTISACYDVDSNATCGGTDPVAPAVTVVWTNSPPVPDAGGPYSTDEGTAVAVSGSATDVNNDPITFAWSYTPVSGVDVGATCAFADSTDPTTTVTCTDDGTYELTLQADDGRGGVASDTAALTVSNVAPVVGAVTGAPAGPISVGTPVNLSATYTDAGSNDTHTAVWAWDDGSTSPAGATGGSTSGTHTYTTPGVYTPCVTVTDDDLADDTSCVTTYIVVYDPDAGFVTGGGWIRSPAGAYTPDNAGDVDVTGRANFGFVSKYKKGATVPTGSTEFQFQAGSLNFHSDAYEWLVVAGHKAIYKGTGTVNGVGGYSFIVSAVDGSPDTFRIKISNSGGVLYDNQSGAADGASATTALAGGSIVIHG
jgi:hypothetical protein